MKKIKATDIGLVFILISYSLLFWVLLSSCNNGTKEHPNIPEMTAKSYYDSLAKKDSLLLVYCIKEANRNDSVLASAEFLLKVYNEEKSLNKKLKDSLFEQNYRIIKAKHYIKIVQKNPHDLGFLVGWLTNQCFN